MNYRSFSDLHRSIVDNIHKIPPETELIVGIPRSGLMAASILALHLHLPLTDCTGFEEGRIISGGQRMNGDSRKFSEIKHVLVLDDSLNLGSSMEEVRDRFRKYEKTKNITYAVVYMRPGYEEKADIQFETCPVPRIFEWNMLNHQHMEKACVDIDGVLCMDPTDEENDDGEKYLHFLENVRPLLRSRRKIRCLITNRLEKYRPQTEAWLKKHHIQYDELVMRDLPSQQARREAKDYGRYKGEVYKKLTKTRIFVESSYKQSRDIAEISGKLVYCVDRRVMIYPNALNRKMRLPLKILKKLKKRYKRYFR